MTPAIRCATCRRIVSDRTGELLHPEADVAVVGADVCLSCKEKSRERVRAAWKRLAPDERAGAATREEREA